MGSVCANLCLHLFSCIPYPPQNVEFSKTTGFREYNLVDVRVTRFKYHPMTGKLQLTKKILVYIMYCQPKNLNALNALPKTSSSRSKKTAQKIIRNYNQAQTWYTEADQRGYSHKARNRFDFVLITLDDLTSAVRPLIT